MTSPAELEAIRIARWKYLKAVGDPASRTFLYADLASGKYDGRPCDTEPQDGKEPAPATEIAESQSIAPDGFDYVKAFEAYWPSRPR